MAQSNDERYESGDDYVIIQKNEIDSLKKQVEELREVVSGGKRLDSVPMTELNESILNLNNSINLLLELFEEASEKLKTEKEELPNADISPLTSKLDIMIDQNKAIAKGILYLVKSDQQEKEELKKEREEQKALREKLLAVQKSISTQTTYDRAQPQSRTISTISYSAPINQSPPGPNKNNQFLSELDDFQNENNIDLEFPANSKSSQNQAPNNQGDPSVIKKGFFKR
jgi:hypothetical protein